MADAAFSAAERAPWVLAQLECSEDLVPRWSWADLWQRRKLVDPLLFFFPLPHELIDGCFSQYCGWLRILLYFESMGNHCVLAFTSVFQGFLGGCKISSIRSRGPQKMVGPPLAYLEIPSKLGPRF